MTVNNAIGAAELLRKYLESPAGSNLLGEMVKMAAELLMDADVDVLCNAAYGERTEARENSRNGHRERRWDTRAGTISLDVPKLRHGSYLLGLLEPRRRVEQARVSTRRVDDLVRSMGIDGMSESQIALGRQSRQSLRATPAPSHHGRSQRDRCRVSSRNDDAMIFPSLTDTYSEERNALLGKESKCPVPNRRSSEFVRSHWHASEPSRSRRSRPTREQSVMLCSG